MFLRREGEKRGPSLPSSSYIRRGCRFLNMIYALKGQKVYFFASRLDKNDE